MVIRPHQAHFISAFTVQVQAHPEFLGSWIFHNLTAHHYIDHMHTFLASVFIVLYASMIFFPSSSEATLKRVARSIGMLVVELVV